MKTIGSSIVILLYTTFLFGQNDNISTNLSRLDSLVKTSMKNHQIVGSSYAIVKGDRIYAMKSFGYANSEKKIPLTNDHQHMFGSISKLITTTLILQLVDEGKLDLHKDIKEYVPYINLKYPTTLHHLLTHTAGLEEQVLDRARLQGMKFESLKDYLSRKMPQQIFTPGEVAAYSNHGIALAGLIAEEVTGIPFEELVKRKVLQPSKMTTASFDFPDSFVKNCATPYTNGKPASLEYVQTVPASMLTGTIKDLAHFMKVQLSASKSSIVKQMQSTQFQPNSLLYGRGYGFFERVFRGKKGIIHGNTRNGYTSLVYLIPEDNLGIVVTATGDNSRFRDAVVYGFLRMLYEVNSTTLKTKEIEPSSLKKYSGSFHSVRTNETKFEKIFHKIRPDIIDVTSNDKSLTILGSKYLYVGNNTFQIENGSHKIAFKEVGVNSYLMLPGRSDFYKKTSFFNLPFVHIGILIIIALLFLILMIRRLILWRKIKHTSFNRWSFLTQVLGSSFVLIFTLSAVINGTDLQYGIPNYFYVLFTLPIAFIVTYILLLIGVLKDKLNLGIGKGLYLFAGALFCFELYYWNFIGWNF